MKCIPWNCFIIGKLNISKKFLLVWLSKFAFLSADYIDGLVQERCNSCVLAMLRLSCISPLICGLQDNCAKIHLSDCFACPSLSARGYDDIIKWKHFLPYWPFERGIHWSPVNSHHKGQWRGALMFSLICAWINGWASNHEAGDLRCHCTHCNVTIIDIWSSA